jgi:hypothetical protein
VPSTYSFSSPRHGSTARSPCTCTRAPMIACKACSIEMCLIFIQAGLMCVCVYVCVCVQNMQGLVKVQLQRQLIWLYCAQSLQFWINRETTVNDLCSMVPMLIGTNVSLHLCLAVPEPSPPQHSDACCIVSMMFSCENQQTLQTLHSPNHTWQPTPMNSSRLTVPASASTVASTSRLGLRVGFTPRAAIMSAAVCATTGLGVNLSCRCRS